MRAITHVLVLSAAFAMPAFAQSEEAASCNADADCPEGQYCSLTDCGAPTCDPDDANCEPVDCGSGGLCVDVYVPPAACSADADCGDGEVCITTTYEACSEEGCACPDGATDCGCDEPQEPVCETTTESFCGPRYLAPCAEDADCGVGFTCEAADLCACSSSSSGDEECACEPSTEKACVLQHLPCDSDTDCALGLTCQEQASDMPCAIAEDGSTNCDAPEADGEKICAPEGYVGGGVIALAEGGSEEEDDASDDDSVGAGDDITIHCAQARGVGMLPLFALLALLAPRRRAA